MRDKNDERNIIIDLTSDGKEKKIQAPTIPSRLANCIQQSETNAMDLYVIFNKLRK